MEPQQNISTNGVTVESAAVESTGFIHRVFAWMSLGLAITAVTAYVISTSAELTSFFIGQTFVFIIIILVQFAAVIYLVKALWKISSKQMAIVFLLYSFFNGITFSVIFLVYNITSIASVFIITAGTFAVMALYGYFTKRDLTTVGNIAFFALVGLVLASVVNIFTRSSQLDLNLAYIGVIIFVALTAYDMQKIKAMNALGNSDTDTGKKEAILGALTLYLDFINLFLKLLRILGKRRR